MILSVREGISAEDRESSFSRPTHSQSQRHSTLLALPSKHISPQHTSLNSLALSLLSAAIVLLVRQEEDGRDVDERSSGNIGRGVDSATLVG